MLKKIKEFINEKRLNTQTQQLKELFPTISNKKIKKLDRELKDRFDILFQMTPQKIPNSIVKEFVGEFVDIKKKDKFEKKIEHINDYYSNNNFSLNNQNNYLSAAMFLYTVIYSLLELIIIIDPSIAVYLNVFFALSISLVLQKICEKFRQFRLAMYILNKRGVVSSIYIMFPKVFAIAFKINDIITPKLIKVCTVLIICFCLYVMIDDYRRKKEFWDSDNYELRLYKK